MNCQNRLFELVWLGDRITFWAASLEVAIACEILVTSGEALVQTVDGIEPVLKTNIPLSLRPDIDQVIEDTLGGSVQTFIRQNRQHVMDALSTFAVVGPEERSEYDDGLRSAGEGSKKFIYKETHNRTSRQSDRNVSAEAWQMAWIIYRNWGDRFTAQK